MDEYIKQLLGALAFANKAIGLSLVAEQKRTSSQARRKTHQNHDFSRRKEQVVQQQQCMETRELNGLIGRL